ncbi:hypothetical protein LTR09_012564 [Extremus antarcticus]|uniref:Uncharacterized protein n=1 Tax=Extremus antarcticus TaxID=702011 RepID=A0AAJ0D4Y9_9PEZI|nr:hypothetical protein LTR09_012564 [Extremus antarcticus]
MNLRTTSTSGESPKPGHSSCEVEPQVHSWKRCCLEEYVRQLYDGDPPAPGGPGQRYYEQNMLHQASSLTSESPKRSRLRAGGLIYSQFYASIKELSDASKCKPFGNEALEGTALDPQIRKAVHATVGGHLREVETIQRAYVASKQRASIALCRSRSKSFSIREEHRISWDLFRELRSQIASSLLALSSLIHASCPPYAKGITSKVYSDSLWRSADKFATGFEFMLANSKTGLLQRDLCSVVKSKTTNGENGTWTWYGLGFSNTLPKHGYCWLESRFDWDRLRFTSEFTDGILFGNNTLHGQQLGRRAELQTFLNTIQQLEMALGWLKRCCSIAKLRERLIIWIVRICLRQFRVDVLSRVKKDIIDDHRQEPLKRETAFCVEYFRTILAQKIHKVSGNRCDIRKVSTLAHLLFDFDDEHVRAYWEDLPFRVFFRHAVIGLRSRGDHSESKESESLESMFKRRFWETLLTFH